MLFTKRTTKASCPAFAENALLRGIAAGTARATGSTEISASVAGAQKFSDANGKRALSGNL
jgi:hypothetical protein